jgi:predicted DCC family thiol-disulfide oxidoreductase YuxK
MSSGSITGQQDLEELLGDHPLLLFDGQCGFCHHAVQWVNRHDTTDRFRFASQESAPAAAVFDRHGIERDAMFQSNSVYLLLGPRLLSQSDVTVNILMQLGGRWRFLGYLLRMVPRFLRNAAYRTFARNRYRIADQLKMCPLPTASDRLKFLG